MRYQNSDIREEIRKSGYFTADVAREMGLSTSTLYTRLQQPLSEAGKEEIRTAIERLKAEDQTAQGAGE